MSKAGQRGDVESKQGFRAGSVPGRDPQLQKGQLSWGQKDGGAEPRLWGVSDSWAEGRNGSERVVSVVS